MDDTQLFTNNYTNMNLVYFNTELSNYNLDNLIINFDN